VNESKKKENPTVSVNQREAFYDARSSLAMSPTGRWFICYLVV